jgi:hypothetical protein
MGSKNHKSYPILSPLEKKRKESASSIVHICDITPSKMNSIDVTNHTRRQDFFLARNILKKQWIAESESTLYS